ncbi:MAG TPA: ATP-binding protein [Gammaproteobacteria bacterium]|nr:ATP-binding protein [Gammaproteobacteria bacterium]
MRHSVAPQRVTAVSPHSQPSIHDDRNLRRLFLLRGLIFSGQAGAVVSVGFWLNAPPPWPVLAAALVILTAANALLWQALQSRVPERGFFVQILVDVAALVVLLYFTGGATNPFVWLLLLQVVIAAVVLAKAQTWTTALATAAAYSFLMWFYQPIPDVHLPMGSGFELHILGMWIGFILSALLIAHFLSSMAANVRARDQALAQAREQALRDDKLISLGTLAASAAHELGTPLGTLSVLTEELAVDIGEQAHEAACNKLALMDAQLDRCKQAIAGIASSAGIEPAQGGHALEMAAFIDTIVSDWRARRTDIAVRCRLNGAAPGPRLLAEKSLVSALINIFDNAADASPGDVAIEADWDNEALAIRVVDRGNGFAPEQRNRVGKILFSGKPDGHGLGLYLSHGIIERLGGKLSIRPRSGGGTAVEVRLPLAKLKV